MNECFFTNMYILILKSKKFVFNPRGSETQLDKCSAPKHWWCIYWYTGSGTDIGTLILVHVRQVPVQDMGEVEISF